MGHWAQILLHEEVPRIGWNKLRVETISDELWYPRYGLIRKSIPMGGQNTLPPLSLGMN